MYNTVNCYYTIYFTEWTILYEYYPSNTRIQSVVIRQLILIETTDIKYYIQTASVDLTMLMIYIIRTNEQFFFFFFE